MQTDPNSQSTSKNIADQTTSIAVMANNIEYIKQDITEIKDAMRGLTVTYVSKEEFEPIKRLVYGLIGIVLTAITIAGLNFILKN